MKAKVITITLPKGCILYLNGIPVMLSENVVCTTLSQNKKFLQASIPMSGKVKGLKHEGLELLQS